MQLENTLNLLSSKASTTSYNSRKFKEEKQNEQSQADQQVWRDWVNHQDSSKVRYFAHAFKCDLRSSFRKPFSVLTFFSLKRILKTFCGRRYLEKSKCCSVFQNSHKPSPDSLSDKSLWATSTLSVKETTSLKSHIGGFDITNRSYSVADEKHNHDMQQIDN